MKNNLLSSETKNFIDQIHSMTGFSVRIFENESEKFIDSGNRFPGKFLLKSSIIIQNLHVGIVELFYFERKMVDRAANTLDFIIKELQNQAVSKSYQQNITSELLDDSRKVDYLYKIFRSLTSISKLNGACEIILEMIVDLVSVNRASIMLYNKKQKVLNIFASKGISGKVLDSVAIKPGEGISGKVFLTGNPVLITENDDYFKKNGLNDSKFATKSFLSIPMIFTDDTGKEETIGVINATDKISGTNFSEEEMNLVSSMASVATIAIIFSRLYQELRGAYVELKDKSKMILNSQESMMRSERLSSLGTLSASVSHEINTPLSIISGAAQMLMLKGDDPGLVKKYSQNITNQISRISNITQKLLGFARHDKPEKCLENINSVISDTLVFTEHYLSRFKKVKIKTQLDKDLPFIYLDKGLLQQVFVNLINNAGDAMQSGGFLYISTEILKNVEIGKVHKSDNIKGRMDFIKITFRDTGPGIPEKLLKKIFESFYTTKDKGMGTGLGLSISKNIIEKHNGKIDVFSSKNEGTSFLIYLPIDPKSSSRKKIMVP